METEKRFKELKEVILKRAKEGSACHEQYRRAYLSETLPELMQVVKDNFLWACNFKVITPGLMERYREEFAGNGIYLNVDVKSGYLLCRSATVSASGSATVKAFGDATVSAFGDAIVSASGNAMVKAFDKATVTAHGIATVKAYDKAAVTAYDKATVYAYGNASVTAYGLATVYASGNAYISSPTKMIECNLSDNAIYRVLSENTIYYSGDSITFRNV